MGANRFIVFLIKKHLQRLDEKRRKKQVVPPYVKRLDNPYIDDGDNAHKFDVIYAKENDKKICVIDIHGGSYIMGSRKNNHYFGSKFVEQGFNFVSMDYKPNDGKHGVEDLLSDVIKGVSYVIDHQEELGLKDNKFFLLGDSAGGHLVLMLTLLNDNESIRKIAGLEFNHLPIAGSLINCPVYQYDILADDPKLLSKSGAKRLFGPKYLESEEYRHKYSPSTYIDELKTPLFVSTCKNCFLTAQSHKLNEDLKARGYQKLMFINIESDERKITHVHNVLEPDWPESQVVNQAMFDFINSL